MGSSSEKTSVAKDLNTLQTRTRYHCEVNLRAQYIPLICTEIELTDQFSCVKLTSKRIQLTISRSR